jgi:hypothetical protein
MLGFRCPFVREQLRNLFQSKAGVIHLEDAEDDGGFGRVADSLDMRPQRPSVAVHAVEHILISVAEHPTTDDMAGFVETGMRFVNALAGLLPVRFVGS